MGKKIFVSYKYSDTEVQRLSRIPTHIQAIARHYVDVLQLMLLGDHIYKGENDDESLDTLDEAAIGSILSNKIFDSTVTIVLISKNMMDKSRSEKRQWVPWEISYALKEQMREDQRSKTNAILAVVLPDKNGVYDYYIEDNTCPQCTCRILKTDTLFQILRDNMFNVKKPVFMDCSNHAEGTVYQGYSSYIYSVKWKDFISNIDKYVNIALEIRANINDYEIMKGISV